MAKEAAVEDDSGPLSAPFRERPLPYWIFDAFSAALDLFQLWDRTSLRAG